jgi:hypothetical protein
MSDPVISGDAAAPLDTTGPLPLSVTTLEFIPAHCRQQYHRQMDGSFRLVYVNEADSASFAAHLNEVTSGALKVFLKGTSPASVEAEAQAQEAMQKEVLAETDRLTAKAIADRQAVLDARAESVRRTNVARKRAGMDPLI